MSDHDGRGAMRGIPAAAKVRMTRAERRGR